MFSFVWQMDRENDFLETVIRSSRSEPPVDNWAEAERLLKESQDSAEELERAGASLQKDLHHGRLLATGLLFT